ncbi:MAG TPA: dTDP-4-dehydrorhamnose reductase [Roseiarcus sp.]|nr:dTDP-4-dehydrorhamnose reductase [Roseiarcus sp.]
MRLLVTGTQGQVARAMIERAAATGVAVETLGRPAYDLLEPSGIAQAIGAACADVVVNAAAYTAVDKAESEPDLAMRVNRDGAGAIAQAAAKRGLPVIQLSTDYVFDGTLERPYREDDPVAPINVYGGAKLAGERAVAAANPAHVVLRTAWVYSPFGANFVKTMLRLGETRAAVNVVADQWGSPTSALDIADAVLAIARRLRAAPRDPSLYGVFHLVGSGEATWADFAKAIFSEAERYGRKPVGVVPIATSDYPTLARRPANSRLDTAKLQGIYGIRLPDWRASLAPCVARLLGR